MSDINDDLVEPIAIQMHTIHSDENDLKWAKQTGKYRSQMRRGARDALTALANLGFAVVKRQSIAARDAEIDRLKQSQSRLVAIGNVVLSEAPADATDWLNVTLDEIRQAIAEAEGPSP